MKKQLALLLASVSFAFLLCEGLVRVAGLGGTQLSRGGLHQYDPEAGWTCKPDLDARYELPGSFNVRVLCNSRGLRADEEIPYEKPPRTQRIVVLGDSFMWGYGVENEEVFSTRLEALLPQTQTVNFGANGYSTVQEVVRFENEGLKYSPDWTVLVFTGNDLGDNFDDKKGGRPVVEIADDGALQIANRPVRRQWKSPVKQWFRHHSKLFGFLEYSTVLIKTKGKERRIEREHAKAAKVDSAPTRDLAGVMEFSLLDLYVEPRPEMDRAWETVSMLLERIHEHMEKTGGRVLIVVTASKKAMDHEEFTERFSSGESLGLDWDRPAARLAEITAAQGIHFVDLHPVFREEEDPMTMFLKNNGHWSAAGHALAARTVAEKIRSVEAESQR